MTSPVGLPDIQIPKDLDQIGLYLVLIKQQGDDTAKKLKELEERFAAKSELASLEGRIAKLESGNSWIVRMGTQVGLAGLISAVVSFVMKFVAAP